MQLTLSLPKLSGSEDNEKSERNSSSSSSSSEDDNGSDYGGYTPNQHETVIKTKRNFKN